MLSPNTILQNRYRVLRELGRGGMGTVYEALDQRVNCLVAVKETASETSDEARRAFEREASLLGNLRHSSLPKVMDYFSEDDGDFLIMEFIPGYDLAELLEERGNPFSQAQVMRWADELLKVLEYLHDQKPPILHRDIKPSNLKLTKQGEIFLLDFGLAKGSLGQMSTLVTSRSVRGYTPSYASLEQIHAHGTDARSDIYSLGATLYHLLTGIAPIDAPTRFHAVEDDQPDPLQPIEKLNSQASSNVAAVIQQAVAISRKHRPVSATEMRKALRNAADEDERHSAEEEYAWAEGRRRAREADRKRATEAAASRAEEEKRLQEAEIRRQEEARRVVEAKRQEKEAERQAAARRAEEERFQAEAEARRLAEVNAGRRVEEERRQADAATRETEMRASVEEEKRRDATEVRLTVPAATVGSQQVKRCPKCSRTFPTPQKFCTYDSGLLEVLASDHRDVVDAQPRDDEIVLSPHGGPLSSSLKTLPVPALEKFSSDQFSPFAARREFQSTPTAKSRKTLLVAAVLAAFVLCGLLVVWLAPLIRVSDPSSSTSGNSTTPAGLHVKSTSAGQKDMAIKSSYTFAVTKTFTDMTGKITTAATYSFYAANYDLDSGSFVQTLEKPLSAEDQMRVQFSLVGEEGTNEESPLKAGTYSAKAGKYMKVEAVGIVTRKGGNDSKIWLDRGSLTGPVKLTSVSDDLISGDIDVTAGNTSIKGSFSARILKRN